THCHIHFGDYGLNPDQVIADARENGVTRLLCVGCTFEDSQAGVEFVQKRDNCWATIGIHPHEAQHYVCDAPTCLLAKPEALSSLLAHRSVDGSSTLSSYQMYDSVHASPSPSVASKHTHNAKIEQFIRLASKPKVVAIGETGLDYYYNHSPK